VPRSYVSSLTPAQRTLRAKIAANTRWSREEDRKANGVRAQLGLLAKFIDQVDPDRVLPEAQRLRRATNARNAHMQRLALRSSKARAGRRTSDDSGEAA
jgi:hypothetical protein